MQFYCQTGGYNNFWEDVVKSGGGKLGAVTFPPSPVATKIAFQNTALKFWRIDERKSGRIPQTE